MRVLAFDTSTDTLSVAVQHGAQVLEHSGPGGAQASTTLIPAIRALLAQAGLTFARLDAVVFGRGPGSFTGLRTACSVAQGLAYGAGVPVLPVNCLELEEEEIRQILSQVLFEFPVKEISLDMPRWMTSLDPEHWLRKAAEQCNPKIENEE